ncbi:MAG: TIGR03936 family radical SAM-associated protein [Eubacteriales bacterium]|nr:TIGR03936 family radical SAM-associated protein [Eubacteriales bacterium]
MRIGLEFEKKDAAKYISHLDLQRAFSRAIRRSGLPVAFSAGFNPHYRVSFASALALGMESTCECVEMAVENDVSPDAFLSAIGKALPPGLYAKRAVRLADNAPKLMAAVREAEYKVIFEKAYLHEIKSVICDIIASREVVVKKTSKGDVKEIDIRSMIIMLDIINDECLRMRLAAAPSGSLKPGLIVEEIIKRTGNFAYQTIRTGLYAHAGGNAIDLLTACHE